MAAEKYSASMDSELLAEVRAAAEDEDETLSAFLAEAAKRRVHLLVAQRALDEWQAEHGAFTEEELAEADDWLRSGGMTPEEALRQERERKRQEERKQVKSRKRSA
jgi:hypothetical protein